MLQVIWENVFESTGIIYPSNWFETVTYNPSLLYSTLIIAILLTKGYGRNIAFAVGRRFLHEPSRKLWRIVRNIKPRQIMYYGLRWGIPLHALKDILLLHRNLLKYWPKRLTYRNSRKNLKKQSFKTRSLNTTASLYRKLPWKAFSRQFGKVMSWQLPTFMREPCIGFYCYQYGVNLQEAFDENLKNYQSLSEFFRRELKPNIRVVDKEAPVVSPADGKVLHFGTVDNGVVEQVKGVNYAIRAFLGPHPIQDSSSDNSDDQDYHRKMNIKPGNQLYNCIVYLAPGDYHRFHSSADWTVSHRRHFPGELLSVKPGLARWIQGLFNFNERVVYSGTWKHGYFSYTAVGATNVGSMKVYMDKELETNSKKIPRETNFLDKTFTTSDDSGSVYVSKGEMFGEFNLGSTIVVMFEAPKNFKFTVEPGQKVKYGEPLGILSKGVK